MGSEAAAGKRVAGENPLVPDRVLRRLHLQLLRQRDVAETMAEAGEVSGPGRAACFAALAVSLKRGDLLSEAGAGLGLLLTAEADGGGRGTGVTALPAMAVATERLLMAVGAGVALKAGGRGPVLAVLAARGEMPVAAWKQMLRFVARLELPMLFAVLPGMGAAGRQGELSAKSAEWGVPGFPVDAEDAVAMYRVVQESMGRLRAGEGPVLLEAVRWGKRQPEGLARLSDQMRARGMVVRATGQR